MKFSNKLRIAVGLPSETKQERMDSKILNDVILTDIQAKAFERLLGRVREKAIEEAIQVFKEIKNGKS